MNKMYYIWEAVKIMFTSLSVFDTTIYLLLLLATVYVAWKKPGKISAIGKIIVVMTLFCVIKDVNILLNEVFVKSPSYCLPSYEVSEIIHRISKAIRALRNHFLPFSLPAIVLLSDCIP